MSLLTLQKRRSHVSQLSNHTPVSESRGQLTTLKRKKLQILKAMSRLTTVLMDIEDVLSESDRIEDMSRSKRPRLSKERGMDHQTVLSSQIERCQRKRSTVKDVISNISNHTNNRNVRKRTRDEADDELIDDNNNSYEIVIRNNFGEQKEEILSCFDCRKLLDALLSKSHSKKVDSSLCEKDLSANKRMSSSNYQRQNVSDVRNRAQQQQETDISKYLKENNPDKKEPSITHKEKLNHAKGQTDVHKQKNKEKTGSKQDKATTKHKTSNIKENIAPDVISANNNVYKTMKKHPDTESVLRETTKQLYQILAGN